MNSKILLSIVMGGLAAVIVVIAFSGSQLLNDVSQGGLGKVSQQQIKVLPIEVELGKFKILSVTEEEAQIQVDFKITNPNYKSVILEVIKYTLYDGDKRILVSQIGDRPEGAIDSSNYFTILRDTPQLIGETITIKNAGTDPEFWNSLQNNTINWRIKGEANFNLSSMTAGQENTVPFEITVDSSNSN